MSHESRDMTRNYNLQYFRCGWQWKDLSRFICLKIWPRLPKQSTRAIRISSNNSKDGLSSIKSIDEKFLYEISEQKGNNYPGNNFNWNNNIEKQASQLEYGDVFLQQKQVSLPPRNNSNDGASSEGTMHYGPMVFKPQKRVSLPPTNNINGASSDDTMHYGPMKHLIIKNE